MTGINLGLNDSVGCIFLAAMFASMYARLHCTLFCSTKTDDINKMIHYRLYGCCLGQVIYYFRNFGRREDKHIKYLVHCSIHWTLNWFLIPPIYYTGNRHLVGESECYQWFPSDPSHCCRAFDTVKTVSDAQVRQVLKPEDRR